MTEPVLPDSRYVAEPIYLTDMTRCRPGSALSAEPMHGRWRTVEYATEALSGVMLMAGPETAAPDVTYPLDVTGWHAVSIGVFSERLTPAHLLVRRSQDQTFSIVRFPTPSSIMPPYLKELFWGVVDLTAQDLVLGQLKWRAAPGDGPGSYHGNEARIAYVKLVPLSDEEATALQADRGRTDTRRLFAHNDAHGVHFLHRPVTAEEIRRHVEHLRDTDFSRLYWEAGSGDVMDYFTSIGRRRTYPGRDDFDREGDRLLAESWRELYRQGIDPFEVALGHAHDIGLEFHASYRMGGFHFPPPHDHFNHGTSFYQFHPELRGTDRNGNRTPRIAYTYPETRRLVVSLFREMAGFPIDGVCLLYNRRPPLVEYEPPLVEGFRSEFGEDPLRLPENDPRWLEFRARVLTQFMQELRDAMDAEADRQGRDSPFQVSAVVMSSEEENLRNGMDVAAWVERGLVDTLIPYTSVPDLDSRLDSWTDVSDAEFFVSLTKGTSTKLALGMLPRELGPEEYRRRASALYDAGVEHLFFWDTDVLQGRADYSGAWSALRSLGHRDEIAAWHEAGEPGLAAPAVPLTRIGDWDLSYASPG